MDDTTTTEAKHSPTPWKFRESEDLSVQFIADSSGDWVAEMENTESCRLARANGRFIVDAVNEVDRLRETVAALVTALRDCAEYIDSNTTGYLNIVTKARAALALVAASHAGNDAQKGPTE